MVLLTCALKCEAKPIIKHFSLKEIDENLFEGDTIKLIITGSRLYRAACGVGKIGKRGAKFLNVGVCGHKNLPLGTPLIAHKLSFDSFVEYPQIIYQPPCTSIEVKTVLHAEEDYTQDDVAYEMEGFSFFKAALTFTSAECISLLKIVSDNENNHFNGLTRGKVSSLIENNLLVIEKCIEGLSSLPSALPERDLSAYLHRFHFTATEKEQLKRLLYKTDIVGLPDQVKHLSSAKEVLSYIERKIEERKLQL